MRSCLSLSTASSSCPCIGTTIRLENGRTHRGGACLTMCLVLSSAACLTMASTGYCRLTKFPERRWISNFSILDSNPEDPHARGGDGIIDGSLSSSESIEGMFNEARKAAALELQKIDQLQAKNLARRLLPTPKSCSTADAAVSSEVMELYRWFAVADDVASPTLSLYPIIGNDTIRMLRLFTLCDSC